MLLYKKAYPIAFIEFSEQNNRKIHDGPYNERDEAMRDDKWMVCVVAAHHESFMKLGTGNTETTVCRGGKVAACL